MKLVAIAHNIRSAYNIGSIFRSADGAGIDMIYLSGYTPVPVNDKLLYLTQAQKMLSKTALGAEKFVPWKKISRIGNLLEDLKKEGFDIVALEQNKNSVELGKFRPRKKTALIIGNEPKGIDNKVLKKCDLIVEIPMNGQKNSLNVSVAFGIAAYHICSRIK